MLKYEKAVWIKIFDLYKNHSHLWDKKNINYTNKALRHESLNMLLQIYKEIDDEATIDSFKSKIMNLRTCFLREIKKVKATSEPGYGPQYVPTLWYYKYLMFLLDDNEHNSSDSVNETVYATEEFSQSDSEQSEDVDFEPKKKIRKIFVQEQENVINSGNEFLNKEEEKREILAKFFAVQLQDIDDGQLTIVNKLISDVVFYAKTGKLTVDSTINLG